MRKSNVSGACGRPIQLLRDAARLDDRPVEQAAKLLEVRDEINKMLAWLKPQQELVEHGRSLPPWPEFDSVIDEETRRR